MCRKGINDVSIMKARILFFLLLLLPIGLTVGCEHPDVTDEDIVGDDPNAGGGTGGGGSSDDWERRYTVMEFIEKDFDRQVWVQGYIVGACYGKKENANFHPPFEGTSAILLADRPGQQNMDSIIPIQLVQGVRRDVLNLEDHPENFGCKAEFFDFKQTYFGLPGMKGAIGAWHLWDKNGKLVEY